jgi:glycosyltransferase involved in cell wall biosynthesis
MAKISVIIPVYNTEQYLKRCLDSVYKQSLKDIEIICVNDCSHDNSLEILKEYAAKDSRIKIIDFPENKGAAIARNTAMGQVCGEYIGFIDSDDFIDLDFYEKLYVRANETGADVVIGNIVKIKENTKKYEYEEFISNVKLNKVNFNGLFPIAIYKKTFLEKNQIEFLTGYTFGEDRLFPLKAGIYANKFEIIEDVYYNYTEREGSASYNFPKISEQVQSFISTTKLLFHFINTIQISSEDYKIIAKSYWDQIIYASLKSDKKEKKMLSKFLLQIYNNIDCKDFIMDEYNKIIYSSIINNDMEHLPQYLKMYENKKTFAKLRKNIMPGNGQGILKNV